MRFITPLVIAVLCLISVNSYGDETEVNTKFHANLSKTLNNNINPLHFTSISMDRTSLPLWFGFLSPNFFANIQDIVGEEYYRARLLMGTDEENVDIELENVYENPSLSKDEKAEADRMIASTQLSGFQGFEWHKWLNSRHKKGTTAFFGTMPFLTIPTRGSESAQNDSLLSKDGMFVFWYINKKF